MLIYYLELGYDVHDDKIHKAMFGFMVFHLKLSAIKAKEIISARHQLKYKGNHVSQKVLNELNSVILNLELRSGQTW